MRNPPGERHKRALRADVLAFVEWVVLVLTLAVLAILGVPSDTVVALGLVLVLPIVRLIGRP